LHSRLKARLAGISGVPITPFDVSGTIDETAFRRVLRRMLVAGIDLLVPCGNTGEQASLSEAEAQLLVGIALEEAASASVLVGVGGSLEAAIRLGNWATAAGADGILVHFPRDPFISAAGLVAYYTQLAEHIDTAIVPYVGANGLPDEVFDSLAKVPNVVAIKYGVPDVVAFARLVRRYPGFGWVCGLAELWAPFFWLAGGRGFTSGLANVAPEFALTMLGALNDADYKRALEVWTAIYPFEELRARGGNSNNVPVIKEALALLEICDATVRPPISALSAEDASEVARIVRGWRLPASSSLDAATERHGPLVG
jgi:4-hydroxy-tetrahydrodipicolinate synthase